MSMGVKIVLTPKQEAYLVKHYRNTKNDILMEKLGLKFSTFHRIVRQLGLTKTKRFMKKCQKETAAAAKASHLRNGTFPPKGYRIPRSEEFWFKPGETSEKRIGKRRERKRIEKCAAARKQTFREEKARAYFGLPQRTKMRVVRQPRQKICDRCYLKRCGYILDEKNLIAYWTSDTRRATRLEAQPRRFYVFKQHPDYINQ